MNNTKELDITQHDLVVDFSQVHNVVAYRSTNNNWLCTVVAVDKQIRPLFTLAMDIKLEEADKIISEFKKGTHLV